MTESVTGDPQGQSRSVKTHAGDYFHDGYRWRGRKISDQIANERKPYLLSALTRAVRKVEDRISFAALAALSWRMRMLNTLRAAGMAVGLIGLAQSAAAETLRVMHPEPEAPVIVAAGPAGVDSPGDTRFFHFSGVTDDAVEVVMDWMMTTTGTATAEGANSRVTQAVFSVGGPGGDQIVLMGAGLYPDETNVFPSASSLVRAIIGGTGAYSDARGVVVSTHEADGSWVHEFRFAD